MKLIYTFLVCVTIYSCTNTARDTDSKLLASESMISENEKTFTKVLFVTSNAKYYGTSNIETTNNFPEIVYAYHEFVSAKIEVDFVSPNGGRVPIGYIHSSNAILQKYLFDATLSRKLKNTLKPAEVDRNAYKAIYFVGGGSAMFDVPENETIQKIAQHIVEDNNGILSAICHGTAGIVNIKNSHGRPIIDGKKITGFPDAFEDTTATYYKEFPFSINKAITSQGASFEYSDEGWDGFYILENNIVTGQDPSSAHLVAKAIIKELLNN